MKRLLIVAILVISTVPLYAQGQQPNVAKLKADAQKVVSIISGDKAKTQTYCQIANLGEQMDQAVHEKDKKKFEELAQRINEGEKQLGPEYLALVDAVKDVDQNSKDAQEIVSIFDRLDESCRH
jgi:DNA repair ATPase RecN